MKYFKDSPLGASEIEATDYDSKYKAKTACVIDVALDPNNEMGLVFSRRFPLMAKLDDFRGQINHDKMTPFDYFKMGCGFGFGLAGGTQKQYQRDCTEINEKIKMGWEEYEKFKQSEKGN